MPCSETRSQPHRVAIAALLALASVVLAACGPAGDGSGSAATVPVVTTTTILADLVHQVGGDRVRVESLVPKGGEVHTFDPTPSDIRRVTAARLVFRNGLGLDDWLGELVAATGTQAPVVALGEDLPGVTLLAGEERGEPANPHLWMNVAYASAYAERIADTLTTADPDGAETYDANLAAYQQRLAALDAYAKTRLGAIPEANRKVVSFHDAFPYFAAAYGLTVDGTVVDAPGQDPSAGQIAALVARIREAGVKAIFAEAQFDPAIVETIAQETGATVVSDLYDDTLGDPPQDTYEGIMRWNVDRVADALGG
jgi:manganese/iron transport system substrate-binding protein